jgi:hypothetical protein
MEDQQGRKIETPVEARAGVLDRPVLVVLAVSLGLIVVLFGLLWLGFNYLATRAQSLPKG